MFTRPQVNSAQDEARQPSAQQLRLAPSWMEPQTGRDIPPGDALIPAGAAIEGMFRSAGTVQIHGSVNGEVRCHALCIEEGGQVIGTVTASSVAVLGLMRGRIEAEVIDIAGSAEIDAELNYVEIGIARGARVSGNCTRRSVVQPVAVAGEVLPAMTQPIMADPVTPAPAMHSHPTAPAGAGVGAVIGLDELKTRLSHVYTP